MRPTPENEDITREHIKGYLEAGMDETQIKQALEQRGATPLEIKKILNDLSSYN